MNKLLKENPEYNWFVETNKGIITGNEYLKDAFEFVLDSYFQLDPEDVQDFLTDTDSTQQKLSELDVIGENIVCVEEFLDYFGYGEPEDDMDDYDQLTLDEYQLDFFGVIQKYFDPEDIKPAPRIIKRDEVNENYNGRAGFNPEEFQSNVNPPNERTFGSDFINISNVEVNLFNIEDSLKELLNKGRISIVEDSEYNQLWYMEDDKDTVDILNQYFNIPNVDDYYKNENKNNIKNMKKLNEETGFDPSDYKHIKWLKNIPENGPGETEPGSRSFHVDDDEIEFIITGDDGLGNIDTTLKDLLLSGKISLDAFNLWYYEDDIETIKILHEYFDEHAALFDSNHYKMKKFNEFQNEGFGMRTKAEIEAELKKPKSDMEKETDAALARRDKKRAKEEKEKPNIGKKKKANMKESMKKIMNFNTFVNEAAEVQAEVHAEEEKLKKEPKKYNKYQEFFNTKLKKYGATGIGSLGDQRSKFFKEIKTEWAKEKEKLLKEQPIKESSGDLPTMSLKIRNEVSKLKKGPAGGTIDLGKTLGKDVSQTDINNIKRQYPDAEIFYNKGRTLLKLKN